MAKKFYSSKSGKRVRIHDSKTGRIIGWEDATTLDRPTGQFKIVEYVLHFKPTRKSMGYTPSSFRNWEVRIRLPDGYDEDKVEELARKALEDITNENMVEDSTMIWDKKGKDEIEYADEESFKWKIVDTIRPIYKYPKTGWGDCDDDYKKE